MQKKFRMCTAFAFTHCFHSFFFPNCESHGNYYASKFLCDLCFYLVLCCLVKFYKMDMIYECPDGTLAAAPPNHIVKELQGIMEAAPSRCEHPVGILTTEHRDNWLKTRQELMKGEASPLMGQRHDL